MYTNPDTVLVRPRNKCGVCESKKLSVALELPGLPLTGIFVRKSNPKIPGGIDQQFLFCRNCGHSQLGREIDPQALYGRSYGFRTSASHASRQGTDFLLSFLGQVAPRRRFNCVLDLGCNDGFLLHKLHGRAGKRAGIDPIWAEAGEKTQPRGMTVIGDTFENVNLKDVLDEPPDLVVCRHTLEHLSEPLPVMEKLFSETAGDALFLFEVPGFEILLSRLRFDQVFHQHQHYFSLGSFLRLVESLGGVYISHRENYHNWGGLLIAFSKRKGRPGNRVRRSTAFFSVEEIQKKYELFRRKLSAVREILISLDGNTVYGYGASQMLPVLAYHLGGGLPGISEVLDDDPARDRLCYWNLPVRIKHSSRVENLETAGVLITAVDHMIGILKKLNERRPKWIIYPLPVV